MILEYRLTYSLYQVLIKYINFTQHQNLIGSKADVDYDDKPQNLKQLDESEVDQKMLYEQVVESKDIRIKVPYLQSVSAAGTCTII